MNRILAALAVTSAVLTGFSAQGAVIVTSVSGPSLAFSSFEGAVDGSTYIKFQDVPLGTTGAFTSNGFNFDGGGRIRFLTTPQAAMPAFDFTKYLALGAGVTETLTLESSYTKFGLYWGSIDSYNIITFLRNGTQVASFGGADVVTGSGFGHQFNSANNRYVNFDFTAGSAFDQVVFYSSQRAFEMDNLALAGHAPELSTWAMMLLGFAGVGFVAWRRARGSSAAVEAA